MCNNSNSNACSNNNGNSNRNIKQLEDMKEFRFGEEYAIGDIVMMNGDECEVVVGNEIPSDDCYRCRRSNLLCKNTKCNASERVDNTPIYYKEIES